MQGDKERNKELSDLTATMFLTLAYSLSICWVIPVVPMILVFMLNYSFTSFITLWMVGLPICALFLFYLYRKGNS
jgi:hypothetical protein